MLFRRLLIASSALLLFVTGLVLTTAISFGSSTGQQPLQYSAPVAANQPPPSCPGDPSLGGQDIFLDYCSPKYVSNVAGPFGSHIVLIADNFPTIPQEWIIRKDSPVTQAQDAITCLHNKTCLALPSPTQIPRYGSKMLFPWTWDNHFPKNTGDYSISAVIGNLTSGANAQVVATNINFTLLTSQAPCITLSTSSDSPTNCTTASQSFPITLSNKTTLTINGSNWALGWGQQYPITETVEVAATCESQNSCNKDPLFDVHITSDKIHRDGSFTISVPLSAGAQGTYLLSATNSVVQIATPGVPDTSNNNINTIATSSLTFGGPEDPITLNINAQPPSPVVTPSPSPTSTPKPQPSKTPTPEPINTDALNAFSILALLPGLLGLIGYLGIWYLLRRSIKQPKSLSTAHQNTVPRQTTSARNQVGYPSPILKDLIEHGHFLISFQSMAAPPAKNGTHAQKPSPISFDKDIKRSIREWRRKKLLLAASALATRMLVEDIKAWNKLTVELGKNSASLSLDDARKIEHQAITAMRLIRDARDAVRLQSDCSEALVHYTVLLSWSHISHEDQAAILFAMGYAYTSLASVAPETAFDLLSKAWQCYQNILENYSMNGHFEFHARTLLAQGDAYIALSKVPGEDFDKRLLEASSKYLEAHKILHPFLPPEIQIDNNLPKIQIDYDAIIFSLPPGIQNDYFSPMMFSAPPEIQEKLEERILVMYYLNSFLKKSSPTSAGRREMDNA